MRGLAGKVVIVTGGGGGIGGATCRRFAAEGAKVAIFDRDLAAAERVASGIASQGGEARAFACDIADHGGVRDAVAPPKARWGRSTFSSTTPAGMSSSPSCRRFRKNGAS